MKLKLFFFRNWTKDDIYFTTLNWNDVCFLEEIGTDTVRIEAYKLVVIINCMVPGVDSFYEYLVKGAALLQKPELMQMFKVGRAGILNIFFMHSVFKISPTKEDLSQLQKLKNK